MPKSSYASRVPPQVLRAHVILGALQVAVGCLVVLLNLAAVLSTPKNHGPRMLSCGVYEFGSAFWTGPLFIIAGASGIVAGKGNSSCTQGCVVTCLVFSIIAACQGFSALVVEAIFIALSWATADRCGLQAYQALKLIYAALFALELVLAVVHSAFACRASCCCLDAEQQQQQQQQQPAHIAQIIVIQPGMPEFAMQESGGGYQVYQADASAAQQPYVCQTTWESQPSFGQQHPPPYEAAAVAGASGDKSWMPRM